MTLLLLALGVKADTLGALYYSINGPFITITDCYETARGELVIPQTIEGRLVTTIGERAFADCNYLTSISIPDSVTSIERSAFNECEGLKSITIPNRVTSIAALTFSKCTNLQSVTISNRVTSIGNSAFTDCTSLTSIIIPNSVTSLGIAVFNRCQSLASITFLPRVAPSLGRDVFKSIRFNATYSAPTGARGYTDPFGGVKNVDTDGDGIGDISDAFPNDANETVDTDGDGVGDNSDAFPNDPIETVDSDGDGVGDNTDAFPDDANETKDTDGDGVGNNADLDDDGDGVDDDSDPFPNDANETKDTDGDGVGDNGDIFANFDDSLITYSDEGDSVTITDCETSASGSLIIPDTIRELPVTSIRTDAFRNCISLTNITIPAGLTNIGFGAFNGCTSLASITIPDSVTTIGGNAFYECTSLVDITIPDSVTSIGEYAFVGCKMTSIIIPAGVTSMGEYAFASCTNLTSVTISNGVTNIGDLTFASCNSLTSIIIPDSVTSVGKVAFYQCSALTTIEVSDGNVDYTDADGVLFNDDLTLLATYPAGKTDSDYTIPEGVTDIEAGAFLYCNNLRSVTLPQSVTNIGAEAFAECRLLKNLFMDGPPPSVGSSAFENLAPNALVNVKREWRANYGAAGNTWYGLFVVEQDEEECDNEELTNTITTLVALLAQKDAQIAEKNAQIVELEKRPSLEDIQEARAGSVVLTPTDDGTVILKMMIEKSSDLSVWENSEESIEVELPLAEGKKFLRFALK
ncbi:leucine-rich repeat protein [Akkermansiaceae bacterium]|nr:leucine-rich repeat protein [Akkermansiaceae bacterium]